MKYLVILSLAICVATATLTSELLEARWANYKAAHNKRYPNGREELFRKRIFEQNVAKIDAHNERYNQGLETYTKGLNLFTDMTPEEIRPYTHGLIEPKNAPKPYKEVSSRADLGIPEDWRAPDTFDWRDQGMVTAVKNQGGCGSCWAFSSTGAIESQERMRRGNNLDISDSEQQLVDCDSDNAGCSGGWPTNAFNYVAGNGGLDSESSYPYEATDGSCRYRGDQVASRLKGYVYLTGPDENAMKDMVVNNGPVSVCFDADGDFGSYSGGVYFNPTCETNKFTHAVLVVGYGNENGQDYWLVKNSWGGGWGLDGYFKIARNRDNHCGIASKAAVPLLAD